MCHLLARRSLFWLTRIDRVASIPTFVLAVGLRHYPPLTGSNMDTQFLLRISWAQMHRIIVTLIAGLSLAARAADEPKDKPAKEDNFLERAANVIGQDAKSVAHAAKQAGRDIGQSASKAGKDIGQAASKAGKDIGHAARKAGKEIGEAFKAGEQKAVEGKETSRK